MIQDNGIRLRAMERNDLPRFVTWLNDPEVIANLIIKVPLSLAQEELWFEQVLKRPVEEQPLVIEVLVNDTWSPIGNIGLQDFDWKSRCSEVGIFIGEKSLWNKGWGTQTMRLLLRYAFKTLNLHRVKLYVYETNPRAIQSYRKAGFIEEGRLRQEEFLNGKYTDVIMMGILQSEWQDNQ